MSPDLAAGPRGRRSLVGNHWGRQLLPGVGFALPPESHGQEGLSLSEGLSDRVGPSWGVQGMKTNLVFLSLFPLTNHH